ncbi:MAG: hypothetical protein U0893_18305 [Chloroflexota bacterium]
MSTTRPSTHHRPGPVREIKGIVLQSDDQSGFGRWFIRPVERLNRWVAGIRTDPDGPSLAMHAGIHVVLENGEEWVAEQLHGTLQNYFWSGFNWTPIETFRARNRGGWDTTIATTAFRGIDEAQVARTLERLNQAGGHPFLQQDCTTFMEHMFSHQMFAHLPLLGLLGLEARIGDPAMPLLRRDVHLDPEQARLARLDEIRGLADTPWGFQPPHLGWSKPRYVAAGAGAALVGYWLARTRVCGRP